MRGLLPVAGLRFREAIAGRVLWLLPLHFALALAAAAATPGPTGEARVEAADGTALALAAALGLVAAAVLGASPLPAERERARGALVLAAPPGAAARALGTLLGAGGALLLLLAGLCASAMAAVDLGAGAPPAPPRAWSRAAAIEGGEPDPREPGLLWLTGAKPSAWIRFGEGRAGPRDLVVDARPRLGSEGTMPGAKRARVAAGGPGAPEVALLRVPLHAPFRAAAVAGGRARIERVPGNLDLGLRADRCRLDDGPRPRSLQRGLHAAALGAGLLAVLAAAAAISTFAGTGVAAAGALALALLSLSRATFADAASMLSHAGAMERAVEAAGHGLHAEAQTVTPPALAPLFRWLAAALPDGTRFDLAAPVAAREVPDAGDAAAAVLLGLGLAALFLALAALGARRRP